MTIGVSKKTLSNYYFKQTFNLFSSKVPAPRNFIAEKNGHSIT